MALKDDTKYTQISNKEFDKHNEFEMPIYLQRLEIGEADTKRIVKEALEEYRFLRDEKKAMGWDRKWQILEAFYNKDMDSVNKFFPSSHFSEQVFTNHVSLLEGKVDTVTRHIMQALFEGDTIWSVSPRAEFEGKAEEATTIAKKQEDWLEFAMTERVPLRDKYKLAIHESGLKGNSFVKWFHEIDTRMRAREEQYDGKLVPIKDKSGQPVKDEFGQPVLENKGLKEFIQNHQERLLTDDPQALKSFTRQLEENKKISIDVNYREAIVNDPMPTFIKPDDFWCDSTVDNYREMTKVNTFERMSLSYRFLKNEEAEGRFYNIDKLFSTQEKDKDGKEISVEDKSKPVEIFMCVLSVKLKEKDKKETRIIVWINKEKDLMIGSILYPAISIDGIYIPFWVKKTRPGLWQDGIGIDLLDLNMAMDSVLNFTSEAIWRAGLITPIVEEGSPIIEQFQGNEFIHGMYLTKKRGETIDFVSNHMQALDTPSMILLTQLYEKFAADASKVSEGQSGRESAIDPNAPASKTLALLEQSNINIQGYVREIVPSFNKTADIVMQYYHQITKEGGQKYRIRMDSLTGSNPFDTITRAEMRGRMLIESQASSFDFEKLSLKRDLLSLYQVLAPEPIFNQNPEAKYNYLLMMAKSWHPIVRNKVDQILPDPQEFQQQIRQLVAGAVQQFIQASQQQAEQTGGQVNIDPQQLAGVVKQLLGDSVTPPSKEEVKAREEAQEGAA